MPIPNRQDLVRQGQRLEYFTIGYNSAEGLVSIVAGILARSVSLIGFGLDSIIEVASGTALLWRLHHDLDQSQREEVERITLRIVGGVWSRGTISPRKGYYDLLSHTCGDLVDGLDWFGCDGVGSKVSGLRGSCSFKEPGGLLKLSGIDVWTVDGERALFCKTPTNTSRNCSSSRPTSLELLPGTHKLVFLPKGRSPAFWGPNDIRLGVDPLSEDISVEAGKTYTAKIMTMRAASVGTPTPCLNRPLSTCTVYTAAWSVVITEALR